MLTKIEPTEQAEALEQHLDITVVLLETLAADIALAREHRVLAPQDQAAGLPYLELQHIEILVIALEVILQAEVLVVALEVVITALAKAVLVVVLTEALVAALEVQAADLHLDLLVLRVEVVAVAVEETKIKHLSPLNY